ncbi:MAG: hypothetical protein M1817_001648 [Caeruleum heppii]|nr:MAG: hypothetical protein M1817_001648 [Caeruleum heppii]
MSAFDGIDGFFNTTSIPSTGIFETTANQFFCQQTKFDVRCLSSAQFAAQPFDQLCPSGDCWTDCQDLERLYAPLPEGITFANQTEYGTPPTVTLWPLCAGLANITRSLQEEVAPPADVARFERYFSNVTSQNVKNVATAATQCWTDTCASSREPDRCVAPCAAANLLETRSEPQLAGTRECIQTMCLDILGLPFGNQDIVGIGVTSSYIIQSILTVLCWFALAGFSLRAWIRRRRSEELPRSDSQTSLVQSIPGFHAAQCYFSIPLGIAALVTNPFTLDPLNAFALLPVAVTGFLPQVFTLMIMHYYHIRTTYSLLLTIVSYLLNTVTFWAVISYLHAIKGQGTALQAAAYKSLGGIDSCGGMTGIGICLQFQQDSPPAFLIQRIGRGPWDGIRQSPWVWVWCTICLVAMTLSHLRWTGWWKMGRKQLHKTLTMPYVASFYSSTTPSYRRTLVYLLLSAVFFAGMIHQGIMFSHFQRLGLIETETWSFGQIVAVTVWIPPVIDYLHSELRVIYMKRYPARAVEGTANESAYPSGAEKMEGQGSSSTAEGSMSDDVERGANGTGRNESQPQPGRTEEFKDI